MDALVRTKPGGGVSPAWGPRKVGEQVGVGISGLAKTCTQWMRLGILMIPSGIY